MKHRYFGTFVPGAEQIVSGILQESGAACIGRLMSGAVEYELEAGARLSTPCLNNRFRVLYRAQAKAAAKRFQEAPEKLYGQILQLFLPETP